jgi:hypothetical protein
MVMLTSARFCAVLDDVPDTVNPIPPSRSAAPATSVSGDFGIVRARSSGAGEELWRTMDEVDRDAMVGDPWDEPPRGTVAYQAQQFAKGLARLYECLPVMGLLWPYAMRISKWLDRGRR